jgi:hypothetical protein
MQIAFRLKLDPEALKAWSQNLGHEDLATSMNSYGKVQDHRTSEIMSSLVNTKADPDLGVLDAETLALVIRRLKS